MSTPLEAAFVKYLLEESSHERFSGQWTSHGFGFMRLHVSEDVRLHVWAERFDREATSLHTHPWSFTSQVFAGAIINHRWVFNPDSGQRFLMQELECGPRGGLVGEPKPIGLTRLETKKYRAGESYSMSSSEIHSSSFYEGTVTVIDRQRVNVGELAHRAYTFWPSGSVWQDAKPGRPALRTDVIRACHVALQNWPG